MIQSLVKRRIRVGLGILTTAGLLSAGTYASAGADDHTDPSRSLQSVNISLGGDASVTAITDTVVNRYDDGSSSTDDHTYTPTSDAQALPVRVQTSYRTAEKSGTQLSDLAGYTGRVRIDVTVQNITVHPEQVAYDSGGVSHREYALVGVPMTVVASADLGKDTAGDVVTSDQTSSRAGDGATTNGVLSQTQDGTGQVQWATLLAPPRLAPSTTFTLVVDAHDFKLPSFDISVQPGMTTDPSITGLLQSAFGTDGNQQMALESRTIELVDNVTGVLSNAQTTLAKVRTTLSESADTLGRKTVAQLQSSMGTVTDNTRALVQNVDALSTSLDQAMNTTRSTAVSQMSQLMTQVGSLLGDTSAQEMPVRTAGSGCQTHVVAAKKAPTSVYGAVLQVSGMLDTYATATQACRQSIGAHLVSTIGTDDVSHCPTTGPMSVTCTIAATSDRFGGYALQLVQDSQSAIDALDPGLVQAAKDDLGTLETALSEVSSLAGDLDYSTQGGYEKTLADAKAAGGDLDHAATALTGLTTAIGGIHTALADEQGRLTGNPDSLLAETKDLTVTLCGMYAAGTLTQAQMQQLTAYTSDEDCDHHPNAAPATSADPGTPYAGSLAERIQQSSDDLQAQIDATDTSSTRTPVGADLAELTQTISDAQAQVSSLTDQLDGSTPTGLAGLIGGLLTKIEDYQGPLDDLDAALTTAQKNQQSVTDALTQAQQTLAADAGNSADALDPTIRTVADAGDTAATDVASLFGRSQQDLAQAAKQARSSAKHTIDRQSRDLQKTAHGFSGQLSAQMQSGITSIDRSVAGADRDTQAAGRLLTGALQQVLVSVGTRKVNGSGLLGIITTSAATTGDGTEQLGRATSIADAFGNVRGGELDGLYLEQAQMERCMSLLTTLAPYRMTLPSNTQHATVYNFHLQGI